MPVVTRSQSRLSKDKENTIRRLPKLIDEPFVVPEEESNFAQPPAVDNPLLNKYSIPTEQVIFRPSVAQSHIERPSALQQIVDNYSDEPEEDNSAHHEDISGIMNAIMEEYQRQVQAEHQKKALAEKMKQETLLAAQREHERQRMLEQERNKNRKAEQMYFDFVLSAAFEQQRKMLEEQAKKEKIEQMKKAAQRENQQRQCSCSPVIVVEVGHPYEEEIPPYEDLANQLGAHHRLLGQSARSKQNYEYIKEARALLERANHTRRMMVPHTEMQVRQHLAIQEKMSSLFKLLCIYEMTL